MKNPRAAGTTLGMPTPDRQPTTGHEVMVDAGVAGFGWVDPRMAEATYRPAGHREPDPGR